MSERLITDRELEGVLRRLRLLERRAGLVEVIEKLRYVTGSWVPTLIGLTTAGTLTYDAANTKAEYTRIGNRVLVNGRVRFTAITVAPVGTMVITGLPFTAATTGFNMAGGASFPVWTVDLPAGYTFVSGFVPDSGTNLQLERSGDNVASAAVAGAEIVLVAGAANFFFEGEYRAA